MDKNNKNNAVSPELAAQFKAQRKRIVGGRPVGDPTRIRKNFTVRLTPEERGMLDKKALMAGASPSDFIRALIENSVVESRVDTQTVMKLFPEFARIGNNINQIAYQLNTGKGVQKDETILKELSKVQALLAQVRTCFH